VKKLTVLMQIQEESKMRRFIMASLMTVFFGSTILWVGCGGQSTRVDLMPPTGKTGAVAESAETPTPVEAMGIPEWFLTLPEDPNHLYATATASGTDLGFALDAAQEAGRVDIAGQIQVKVSGLFKRFREEVGVGEDAELASVTTIISKQVVSEVLSGARVAKRAVRPESSVMWTVYVLVEMPIGLANVSLVKNVKANKDMYAQFRASQAFKELEAEVAEYEQSKREQEQ
jgi:hypothetical protein